MNKILHGNCLEVLKTLEDESVDCCVTSPPYWGLRDYGDPGQEWPAVEYSPMAGIPAISIPPSTDPLGLENSPEAYIAHLVAIFREVRRVLKKEGTLWLNIGDSYSSGGHGGHAKGANFHGHGERSGDRVPRKTPGLKPKNLVGVPWRLALALQADGWYLRQDIIWHKPNPMPESVKDRCTKAHEYIFLLSKSPRYHFDQAEIKEPGVTPKHHSCNSFDRENAKNSDLNNPNQQYSSHRPRHPIGGKKYGNNDDDLHRTKSGNEYISTGMRNKRSVWSVTTKPFKEAHYAVFPPDLVEPCILAGCPHGGIVLDPFIGAGTTALVALCNGRKFIGIELMEKNIEIANKRLTSEIPLFYQG